MLEALNNVRGIVQLFQLHQEYEKPHRGFRYKHETVWRPSLITSSSKNIVDSAG